MTRVLYYILLTLVLLMLQPQSLQARRQKKAQTEMQPLVLTDQQRLAFDSLYFEAVSLSMQDRGSEAVNRLNEALEVDSLSAPARYMRGRLMYASLEGILSQYRDEWMRSCIHDLEVAVQVDSTNFWYSDLLGNLYRKSNMYDKAIDCFRRITRLHPTKSDSYYSLADIYVRMDSLRDCFEALQHIEEIDGPNPNLTLQKFYVLRERGMVDEAFAEYDKLIARNPYDISYRLQLGDLQMKSGMIPQAKKTYDQAAALDPNDAYVWLALSNYYSITGNQQAADSLVHCALVNVNLDVSTKIEMLTEYLKNTIAKVSKEKAEASDTTAISLPGVDSLFVTVSTMHPTAAEVYDLHAEYLAAIGQDSAAMAQILFAVDLKPSETKYWGKALGYAAAAGDLDRVMQLAAQAQVRHPQLKEIYLTRAFVYVKRHQNDSAMVAYREALTATDAKDANFQSHIYGMMGDLYHEMGDTVRCYEHYDLALRYNNLNYVVLNNYAYFLCEEGGDLMKAESMVAKVVQKFPDEPTYLDTYAWIYYKQGNFMLAKFYQQRAMDRTEGQPSEELVKHYKAILEALGEPLPESLETKE